MTRAILACAALAVALALTGCTAAHTVDAKRDPSPTPTATLVTEILPLGFPQVPLGDAPILHVSHPGNIWAAWVYSEDLPGDLALATAALSAAGYEQTTSGDGWADFHGTDYEVRVVALVDDKFGSSLAYTIAEKTGN